MGDTLHELRYIRGNPGVVRAAGEWGATTTADLEAVVRYAFTERRGAIVIDLADVVSADVRLVEGLVRLQAESARTGTPISLRGPRESIRRLFDDAGVSELFEFL